MIFKLFAENKTKIDTIRNAITYGIKILDKLRELNMNQEEKQVLRLQHTLILMDRLIRSLIIFSYSADYRAIENLRLVVNSDYPDLVRQERYRYVKEPSPEVAEAEKEVANFFTSIQKLLNS